MGTSIGLILACLGLSTALQAADTTPPPLTIPASEPDGETEARSLEIVLPSTPIAEGQTLLEWTDPAALRYTIPESERGHTQSCNAQFFDDIPEAALTCWPILRAWQLWLLADFAAAEPTGDKHTNLRQAIEYADQTLNFIGEPHWPLTNELRARAFRLKARSELTLGNPDAALISNTGEVDALLTDPRGVDDWLLAYALAKRTDILLELGNIEGARLALEEARGLLNGPWGERIGSPFSRHSRATILHALKAQDFVYAEETTDRYLAYLAGVSRGMAFGVWDHIDFKLYFLAARGEKDHALNLLEERQRQSQSAQGCGRFGQFFPQVLAPLRQDLDILKALKEMGCDERDIASMEAVPERGIRNRAGDMIAPYRQLAN